VTRVLLTGMSGAGKTTILTELRRRGHVTVDTDDEGWTLPDGLWDEPRMARLLASTPDVVVSGTVDNQGRFYDRFDHVVLLSAPLDVLLERVARRTNNPYGGRPDQRAEISEYLETVEPLLRRGATLELDGRRDVRELADRIERLSAAKWRWVSEPEASVAGRSRSHIEARSGHAEREQHNGEEELPPRSGLRVEGGRDGVGGRQYGPRHHRGLRAAA
jgi:shikimate kinase